MSTILDALETYDTLAGYAILSNKKNCQVFISDIGHIIDNCKRLGLADKLVGIKCNVFTAGGCAHIPTYNVFTLLYLHRG